MKLSKEGIKEFINKKKEEFNSLIGAPAVPAAAATPPATPAVPAAAAVPKPCGYAVDGGANVYVDISDDSLPGIDAGDKVYSDAAMTIPYPDGTYNVTGTTFGFTVAGGSVSAVNDPTNAGAGTPIAETMAAAPATPAPVAPAAPVTVQAASVPVKEKEFPRTDEELKKMYEAFAVGSTEERLTNAETFIKVLMNYAFGWQIRDAQEKEAVALYREELQNVNTEMAAHTEKMAKHVELTKGLFEMCEKLLDEPTDEPKTLTGNQKARFEKMNARDQRLAKMAEAMKKNKLELTKN